LTGLWLVSGAGGPVGLTCLPWLVWILQLAGRWWPWLARQPEWRWALRLGQRLTWSTTAAYLGLALATGLRVVITGQLPDWHGPALDLTGWPVWGLGCVAVESNQPEVTVTADGEGGYTATLSGQFRLHIAGDDPFRKRLLALFLRQLEIAPDRRAGRRTRDGRTPFVRQQTLAEQLGVPQPDLSRWEHYLLDGDWRRLLSQHAPEILTVELQQQVIDLWAHWPNWSVDEVHAWLVDHGLAITRSQVEQAAHDSGWQVVRRQLGRLCVQAGQELRLREGWLVGELLAQHQALLDRLAAGQGLTPEERLDAAALQAASAAAGLTARPPIQAKPWLVRVEGVLFGPWETVTDGRVRCLYCHSTQVGRKSNQPRRKRFLDEQGQVQTVEVYRYYCHNPACARGSFTALPLGLVPYSRHRLEVHVLALQGYAWYRSCYRRTAQALAIQSLTCYRWVSAFGHDLLPMAALFGVVRSSGVVGVDEKWVKVPKSDKPEGKMRQWMYVYLAVDVHTYDLLHIAIYPHNHAASAQAFLLALRAKGYQPRVIVTDLRRDYAAVIQAVFPHAEHHECIFHALQEVHRSLRDVYGPDYAERQSEAAALKQAVDDIFATRTRRTAVKRYGVVMSLRESTVRQTPGAAVVFDFLERHWPTLVNGIESDLIPTTNNAVELVIRRFDQHYQNFCGFESLETAHVFLGVFEKSLS
jgi:transposase-like protein